MCVRWQCVSTYHYKKVLPDKNNKHCTDDCNLRLIAQCHCSMDKIKQFWSSLCISALPLLHHQNQVLCRQRLHQLSPIHSCTQIPKNHHKRLQHLQKKCLVHLLIELWLQKLCIICIHIHTVKDLKRIRTKTLDSM